jgi:hypothetical protein
MFGKPRPIEVLQRVVVPLLAAITALISILKDQPRVAAWAIATVLLALVSTYVPAVLNRLRGAAWQRRDERLLRSALFELRGYVMRFEQFLSFQDGTPCPYRIVFAATRVVSKVAPGYASFRFDQLKLGQPELLSHFLRNLRERCASRDMRGREVQQAFLEFQTILYCFDQSQLLPLFNNHAETLRAVLGEKARSELNAAREEYAHFFRQYCDFIRELNGRLKDKVMPPNTEVPKPL